MNAPTIIKTVIHDRLCKTLADVSAAAERAAVFFKSPIPPDMDAVADARWALARAILEHLNYKEKYVFAALEQDDDPSVRAKAKTLRQSQQPLHDAMHKQMTIWSRQAVEANWPGYCQAAKAMHKVLADRIALEERDLHPLVYRAESQTDTMSSQNWARIAWEIRDSVYTG